MAVISLFAKIERIIYQPYLCKELKIYPVENLGLALSQDASFILKLKNQNDIAISWWVSAKRTRSYPYARVYDTLAFSGKKVAIIPIMKDEGKDGDRDFLQWDTVSLMSLFGIYTIIAYYKTAEISKYYRNKITNQKFDLEYVLRELERLLSYQSDALHWNIDQVTKASDVLNAALEAYKEISSSLNVEMHSFEQVTSRIKGFYRQTDEFLKTSRSLSKQAQIREVTTRQPKEKIQGEKASITIKNYLGGNYHFTCDEIAFKNDNIFLIEAKHSANNVLPSLSDIKDGLIKMILFTNLKYVEYGGEINKPVAVLKLTNNLGPLSLKNNKTQKEMLILLKKEMIDNHFIITINGNLLTDLV